MRIILSAAVLALAAPLLAQTSPSPVQADAIKEDVRILSSDAFQGRGPGERGETMTLAYLKQQFEAAGLQPGGPDGSWFQDVPLVRLDKGAATFTVTAGGEQIPTARARDWSIGTSHEGTATVENAPVVFAGFGIHAPELGWDDYAGADVRGKVVLILPNDPDFDQATGPFGGRQRSRYAGGKARAAFDRGAVAVIQIHREALTSWPWQQLWNSDPNPTFRLASAPGPQGPARLTGYVTGDLAAAMLSRGGLDLEGLIIQAQRPGFRAIAVPNASVSASAAATASPMITRNIVAKLEGRTRPTETILFGAHWDAYGAGPADATGDTIRNGAVDNAIGTATLLEVARAFARGPQPQRTLLFVGYTSEEDGLLGAYHYVANPVSPLETTAAVFNLDPHLALPATRSVELIGAGRVDLEDDLPDLRGHRGAASSRKFLPKRVGTSDPTITPLRRPGCRASTFAPAVTW